MNACLTCLLCFCSRVFAAAGQNEVGKLDPISDDLKEMDIAVKNRFIPILMVPEAAQYRNDQKRFQLQRHQARRHEPAVIRAASPVPDHVAQRELLTITTQDMNITIKQQQQAEEDTQPSKVMMVIYGLRNAALFVWYWLPTQEEILLWLSEFVPGADALIMDYYRLRLGRTPLQQIMFEIPVDPLDQALHDAWIHK